MFEEPAKWAAKRLPPDVFRESRSEEFFELLWKSAGKTFGNSELYSS